MDKIEKSPDSPKKKNSVANKGSLDDIFIALDGEQERLLTEELKIEIGQELSRWEEYKSSSFKIFKIDYKFSNEAALKKIKFLAYRLIKRGSFSTRMIFLKKILGDLEKNKTPFIERVRSIYDDYKFRYDMMASNNKRSYISPIYSRETKEESKENNTSLKNYKAEDDELFPVPMSLELEKSIDELDNSLVKSTTLKNYTKEKPEKFLPICIEEDEDEPSSKKDSHHFTIEFPPKKGF